MIRSVSVEQTTFNELPYKFEAGTPNIAGVIGLAAAVEYFSQFSIEQLKAHDKALVDELYKSLDAVKDVRILGPKGYHQALVTFVIDNLHPHDLCQYLDRENIAVRGGHHCAQPLMSELKIGASTRASFGIYNSLSDVNRLVEGIEKAKKFFKL